MRKKTLFITLVLLGMFVFTSCLEIPSREKKATTYWMDTQSESFKELQRMQKDPSFVTASMCLIRWDKVPIDTVYNNDTVLYVFHFVEKISVVTKFSADFTSKCIHCYSYVDNDGRVVRVDEDCPNYKKNIKIIKQ